MLEVRGIENGIVIDHISAGNGLKIFEKLGLEKVDKPVVLLMGVSSKFLGKKDIIKIEQTHKIDLNTLGLLDRNITVNYIEDGKLVDKKKVEIPREVTGIFTCKNPRCITNIDDQAKALFTLVGQNGELQYQCDYCDEVTKYKL